MASDIAFNIGGKVIGRGDLSDEIYDAVETCITFCKETEAITDLFLWLLTKATELTASMHGDFSKLLHNLTTPAR